MFVVGIRSINAVPKATFRIDNEFLKRGVEDGDGSWDNSGILWKTATGKIYRKLKEHPDLVRSVAFSPDGRSVASGCKDGSVRIWNTSQGKVEHILTGHSAWVHSQAFSDDGLRLVSGSRDHSVRIWNTSSGAIEHT